MNQIPSDVVNRDDNVKYNEGPISGKRAEEMC